jgi:DNA polymerase delta subunit 2
MIEDESGRIRLIGDRLKKANLVTGVIIGALGMETGDGNFEVADLCYAGMPSQEADPDVPPPSKGEDKMDIDGVSLTPHITNEYSHVP